MQTRLDGEFVRPHEVHFKLHEAELPFKNKVEPLSTEPTTAPPMLFLVALPGNALLQATSFRGGRCKRCERQYAILGADATARVLCQSWLQDSTRKCRKP